MADNTDLVRKVTPLFNTALTDPIGAEDTTILLDSIEGLATDTAITLNIDETDNDGNPTPDAREVVTGVVSTGTSSLINVLRGLDGTTAQTHGTGAAVVQWWNANMVNDFMASYLAEHNQDGSHGDVSADEITIGGQPLTSLVPSGIIVPYGGTAAPAGWVLCQGQLLSRSTYSTLFAVIGTAYGAGDGTTTFAIPNLQSNVPVGLNSGDTSFAALGQTGGEKTHVLVASEMPSHSHGVNDPGHAHGAYQDSHNHTIGTLGSSGSYGFKDGAASSSGEGYTSTVQPGVHIYGSGTGISIASAGSDGAHNNLQPYITVNYMIKT